MDSYLLSELVATAGLLGSIEFLPFRKGFWHPDQGILESHIFQSPAG